MTRLHERDLILPEPPEIVPANATPFCEPLEGIRAVTWSIYGTLLRISEGRLEFLPEDETQLKIALDKTIHAFNMWFSMTRRPGLPWESMLPRYRTSVTEQRMAGTARNGDVPEVDAIRNWRRVIDRLRQKEYEYDEALYGNLDEYSTKIAYFFHANLQGVATAPNAARTVTAIAQSPVRQGFLADAQSFTIAQMLRLFREEVTLPPLDELFDLNCWTLSFLEGVRKPSPSLYEAAVKQFAELGIAPGEVLHVGSRLRNDLAAAKSVGMRTALYAADKISLRATKDEMRDPALKPDRLVTDLIQVRDILAVG